MSALVRSGIGRERVCMSEAVNAAFQMNCEEHFPLNLSEEVKVSHANSFRTINISSREVFIMWMWMIHVDTFLSFFKVKANSFFNFMLFFYLFYCATDKNDPFFCAATNDIAGFQV